MSDITLGNQNEKPQDLDKLEMNLEAAIEQQVKDSNANPSKFASKGAGFDMITELGMAKASAGLGSALQVNAETAGPTTGTNSAFLMSGTGRKSKASRRLESLSQSTNAMGLPKTYREMKEDGKTLNRIMAGRGKVSKDPMSGGGDRAIKVMQAGKKKPLSVQAVRNNPELARSIGAGDMTDTLALTRKEKRDPSATAIVLGALENKQPMVERAKGLDSAVKESALKHLAGPKPPAYLLDKKKE